MSENKRITVAFGDGIGPEITKAALDIMKAAKVPLEYDIIEVGKEVYLKGITSGIPTEAWDTIIKNKVLLKGPITTPQGGGYKSLNVTLRKALGLFANVRNCKAYTPFVQSFHPSMDLTIIRENEEDLYAGIEHRQTSEVVQVLKLITRPGSESIIRYAFEYARAFGRKKVTCMTKDNIMKHTDGLFHRVFDEIAEEYPDLKHDHQIIDIGAARLAAQPESLDVIVTLNLYGDILSDIAAQVAGSVGLAGSANIGREAAMFEAIHGSAPDIAGLGVANPSGLLKASVEMLVHLGLPTYAELIKNAWLVTLEDGIHTADIYNPTFSTREVGTQAFTEAVIERLGRKPDQLRAVNYEATKELHLELKPTPERKKELVGVDIFLDWHEEGRQAEILGKKLEELCDDDLKLKMITNRGVMVYPRGLRQTFKTDHWRCRFTGQGKVDYRWVIALMNRMIESGLEVIKTENLYTFHGEQGFSQAQGE